MEVENIVKSEATTVAFPLNYDCMCAIFQRLEIEECMNLAEAYDGLQTAASLTYKKKFSKIAMDFDMAVDIDRILRHVGPHITSLELMLFDKFSFIEEDLVKIHRTCKGLKTRTLIGFHRSDVKRNPFCGGQLEKLTLAHCSLASDDDFFYGLTNLKYLNMLECRDISNIAMKKCFQNNQKITSLVCDTQILIDLELLELLPNLERLALRYNNKSTDLSCLSKLNSLRSLSLRSLSRNVNINVK